MVRTMLNKPNTSISEYEKEADGTSLSLYRTAINYVALFLRSLSHTTQSIVLSFILHAGYSKVCSWSVLTITVGAYRVFRFDNNELLAGDDLLLYT